MQGKVLLVGLLIAVIALSGCIAVQTDTETDGTLTQPTQSKIKYQCLDGSWMEDLSNCAGQGSEPSENDTDESPPQNGTPVESQDPCKNVTCSEENKCIEGNCVEKTCAERNGIVCSTNEQCTTGTYMVIEKNCCFDSCFDPAKTCVELGGKNCDLDRPCDDQTIASSDNPNCCLDNCVGVDCVEEWSCGAWSDCVNDVQTRYCTDLHSCGTVFSKPETSMACGALNCIADIGEVASDGCDESCNECKCTASYDSPYGFRLTPSLNWTTYICVYTNGGENVAWSRTTTEECQNTNYYLFDNDYLNTPCRCGNYFCRYRSFDPGTFENPQYWDRCENNVCLATPNCESDAGCDDGDECTIDTCGHAGLTGYCGRTQITECKTFSDGCCPEGCDYANDGDCQSPSCSDDTSRNSCSIDKPKYCYSNGTLADYCSECGCPTGKECTALGSCLTRVSSGTYIYTESDFLNAGFDTTGFVQRTEDATSTEIIYSVYISEISSVAMARVSQGNFASDAYNANLIFYQSIGFSITNQDEYGDRSARIEKQGENAGALFIEKDNWFLIIVYFLDDESKANQLAETGVGSV